MSWALPFLVSVTSFTTDGSDEYGNPIPSGSSVATGIAADRQPLRADEITGLEDRQIEEWRFYLETGTAIDGGDRITFDGLDYEVVGPPEDRAYSRPLDHVRCRARRVT